MSGKSETPVRPKQWPVATILLCSASAIVTTGYLGDGGNDSMLTRWGWVCAADLWTGHRLWGVVTNTLLHHGWVMLVLDVFWIAVLSAVFEKEFGVVRWMAFWLGACILSNSTTLAFDGNTCIGSSGILYAFVGFGCFARSRMESFAKVLTKPLMAFFLFWLVSQWLERIYTHERISTAAHLICAAYGCVFAITLLAAKLRLPMMAVLTAMTLASISTLMWCPWSPNWVFVRGTQAYYQGRHKRAEELLNRSVEMGIAPTAAYPYLAWLYVITGETVQYDQIMRQYQNTSPAAALQLRNSIEAWKQRAAAGTSDSSNSVSSNERSHFIGPL